MKFFVAIAILLISSAALSDKIFNSAEYDVSFRYPDDWSERDAQLHTTIILLYADDGSEATCNLTAGSQQDLLIGRTESELNALRLTNHTEKSFDVQLSKAYANLVIIEYWRGMLGQKAAGYVEVEHDSFFNDKAIRFSAFLGSTFANERRFTLLCNAPLNQRNVAKKAFDYIRNTLFFLH